MSASRFYSARLKVERANKHIRELQVSADAFAKDHPHVISVKNNPDTGNDMLCIAPAEPFPNEMILILGDAIHNLRSALDHAWQAMVFTPTAYTKFPVSETRQALEGSVNGGLKENSSEKVRKLLVNHIQPYCGGSGELILALYNLDIEDKHRLLIASRQFSQISGITVKDERNAYHTVPDWLIVPPHTACEGLNGLKHFEVTNNGSAMLRVTFGDGMPLQGQFVMPELRAMVQAVSSIINVLEYVLTLP